MMHAHSGEHLREQQVAEQDEDAAMHHGIGTGATHFDASALYRIAIERGDTADDESKEEALDNACPNEPLVELILKTIGKVVGFDDTSQPTGGISADDACADAERHQKGNHGEQRDDFGKDEKRSGVDAHDFERINLLGDAHGAQLRSNVTPHLARQDKAHDGGGELKQHDFARGVTRDKTGHPRSLDIEFDLHTDDRADKKRNEQDDADAIDTEFGHLARILFQEAPHPLRTGENFAHQHQVAAESLQRFYEYHFHK